MGSGLKNKMTGISRNKKPQAYKRKGMKAVEFP